MQSLLSSLDRLLVPAPDPARVGWLKDWTYAHRGLHAAGRAGGGAVENSPAAFRAAIEAGFGIECDIQRSRDDWPMVYHDWDFSRLHGRSEAGEQLAKDDWLKLRYADSDEGPFTLSDLLAMVAGRVPLLIEIKSRQGYDVTWTCRRVIDTLQGYEGRHAVMSFDPRVSRWLRKHSPGTVRGLVMRQDANPDARIGFARNLALYYARPDFLAFDVRALPDPLVTDLRMHGLPILTWTVKTQEQRATARTFADAPIAEGEGIA